MSDGLVRLQKFLSERGAASRRKAEELIGQGRVSVNGRPAQIGDKIDPKKDVVALDGKKVGNVVKPIYIMLHKPRGYITTMSDEMGRKCVAELVRDAGGRVYPIGRLDRESEGLLLLTNDGEFANLMMHPANHVPKYYRVTVRPDISDEQVACFEGGMVVDGRKTAPAKVRVLERQDNRAVLESVLFEGRNRQIRRMCEALSLDVARLRRTAFGPVKLGMLPTGQWRALTRQEIEGLTNAARGAQQQRKGSGTD